jgi:RNA-binding protein
MTPDKRRQLRARAHALDAVVLVGQSGLSGAVLQEVERALKTHELIKIRVAGADRTAIEGMLGALCAGVAAEPVQHIGRVLVIYRENPALHRPAAAQVKPSVPRKGARRRATRSARP